MYVVLFILQSVLCIGLIFMVLLHSGKDSGLSGAFGVGGAGSSAGGGSMVERNLTRWTVTFAVVMGINTVVLVKFF
jgi:preprotein translocase subunit SecG